MIRLSNIEKSFSHGVTRTYVLRRIDLDIQQGEFVSIMGPSGAGKSTLLHILGMHDQSWGGEYYFDDAAVHSLNPKSALNFVTVMLALCSRVITSLTISRCTKTWRFRSLTGT